MKNKTKTVARNKNDLMISAGICLLIAGMVNFFCTFSAFAKGSISAQVSQKNGHNINQTGDDNQGIEGKVVRSHQKTAQQIDANAISRILVTIERGGLDKASEHLQILQQTTPHFVAMFQARKPVSVDKKQQSNS